MEESRRKFWIVIGFWMVGLILILVFNGCDLKAAAQGRFVTKIMAFSVGDFHCETVTTGQDGAPISAESHDRAAAYVNEQPVCEPGLKPTLTYSHQTQWPVGNSYPGSTVVIEADKVTGDDGSILIRYKNSEWWPTVIRKGGSTISYPNRHVSVESAVSGGAFFNARCNYHEKLIPWSLPIYTMCPICNAHWTYGGNNNSGSICGSQWVPVNNKPANSQSMNNQSQTEIDFIETTLGLPESGYRLEQAVWLKQMGSGQEWVKPVDYVFPVNYPDTDTEPNRVFSEMVRDWAHPYYVSFLFTTAESVSIEGMRFIAKVSCDGQSGVVSVIIIKSNTDGTRHIARTGGILPMDREIKTAIYQVNPRWRTVDPNETEDILVIEMPPNKPLEVECDVSNDCIVYAAPYWLSGNKTMDLNGDGVVNFNDIERIE